MMSLERKVRKVLGRALPEPVKRAARRLELRARDRWEVLSGTRDALTPPMHMLKFIGSDESFRTLGDAYLRLFRDLADLKRDERVLDVGCGVGRMAVSLAHYLNAEGSYDGFDCWKDGITWCRRNITRRFPNFRFQHIDVYNGVYNPTGRRMVNELTFPYPDSSFDFITLNSVFTHMLPGDVMRYLREIRRVLRPGGRVFVTWFLLDDDTRELLRERKRPRDHAGPWLDFSYDRGNYWTTSADAPESAVAYDVEYVRASYSAVGLTVKDPIRRGEWPGRPGTPGAIFQDIIVADGSAI